MSVVYTKTYLGDGVYCEFNSKVGQFILTTDNGLAINNTIYLEPEVVDALLVYITAVRRTYQRGER